MDKPWVMFAVICAIIGSANTSIAAPLSLVPATMPAISTVDARYQSYNVEMAEVVGRIAAGIWTTDQAQKLLKGML